MTTASITINLEDIARAMHRDFARTTETGNTHRDVFQIAGFIFQVVFSSTDVAARLTTAISHLAGQPDQPADFQINVWESDEAPCVFPRNPNDTQITYLGERYKLMVEGINSAASLVDMESKQGYYWVRNAATLPGFVLAAPFRVLLHWWLREEQHLLVHAAVIGDEDGAVLIVGQGGSGKSTTSLSCVSGGLGYLGDDYCVVALSPRVTAYTLYNSAKVIPDNLKLRLPHLWEQIRNPEEMENDKAVVFVSHFAPEQIKRSAPIKAILLPQITNSRKTSVAPTNKIAALRALAPSSLLQMPGQGQADMSILTQLVQNCPAYDILLGSDVTRNPVVIRELLESL